MKSNLHPKDISRINRETQIDTRSSAVGAMTSNRENPRLATDKVSQKKTIHRSGILRRTSRIAYLRETSRKNIFLDRPSQKKSGIKNIYRTLVNIIVLRKTEEVTKYTTKSRSSEEEVRAYSYIAKGLHKIAGKLYNSLEKRPISSIDKDSLKEYVEDNLKRLISSAQNDLSVSNTALQVIRQEAYIPGYQESDENAAIIESGMNALLHTLESVSHRIHNKKF